MNIFTTLLTQPLANGLILFYKVLGENMGIAIIAFAVFLRLILTPMTKPYMDSMKKMREFAPQLAKLKKKYKGDNKKFMTAQADFYKQKGINPGAGCLPLILQIVVIGVMISVFSNILSKGTGAVNELLYAPLKFGSGATINTHFLYMDLAKPDLLKISLLPFAIPGPVLILSAIFQMFSAKMAAPLVEAETKVAKSTKGDSDDIQAAMQSSAIYTFPIITIISGVRFASGIALCWLLFSVYQVIQQYRSMGWGGARPWLIKLHLVK